MAHRGENPFRDDRRQEAFLKAAARGDIAAVERYFALPDVLENVAIWNVVHRAERLDENRPRQLPRPWYYGTRRDMLLFTEIVHGAQSGMLRWFFSPESTAVFGETLRHLASDMARMLLFESDFTTALEMLEIVLDSAVFIDIMDDQERLKVLAALLDTAASRGYHDWVNVLLAYGADPNGENKYPGFTPLVGLAYQGTPEIVRLLVDHGSYIHPEKAIIQYVFFGNPAATRELLRLGSDANIASTQHGSPLHYATELGVDSIIRALVEGGFADVDGRDQRGCTSLMMITRSEQRGNAERCTATEATELCSTTARTFTRPTTRSAA